ncbi:MAG: DNA mismatch repair endonuclease MutL [Halolamina sp.]|uniref:DNA mismatch repair endonuclease MutL n=1 Tax=Halolamina sp. TaxID=1940283 RepID=UPI002FC28D7F
MSEDSDTPAGRDGDSPSITSLDEATVQRIAAGEVVERPASVVKELLENGLDADASRVSVAVERGGKDGIRVRDDGVGMTEAELDLAVRDHHTSKIGDISDLEAGVGTLGFRGEALAAVGAVSQMTLRSKPRGGEMGHELTVTGGDIGTAGPAGCPVGTVVEVADLFFNVPARRKFLKTDATEFDHVNTVVTQYALANPDVAVSLEHDGREVFATEGNGDLRSTVLSVYGREVAEAMVDVEWRAEGATADAEATEVDESVLTVQGLVSHPETTRAGREYLSTFVNDRYVTASVLREAVLDAYGGQLASDRYPFAVLFVEVDPVMVDVNVHPRKMEVRFDDEAGVKKTVEEAVTAALLDHGLVRRSAPRGRSKADEAAVSPGDDEVVGGANTPHETESGVTERRRERSESGSSRQRSGLDRSGGSSSSRTTSGDPHSPTEHSSDAPGGDSDTGESARADAEASGESLEEWTDGSDSGDEDPPAKASDAATVDRASTSSSDDWAVDLSSGSVTSSANQPESTEAGGQNRVPESGTEPGVEQPADAAGTDHGPDQSFTAARQQALGGGEVDTGGEFDSLPAMRVLGQLHDTYVVAETDGGLVLVDQHAADERVNYERLRRQFADGMATQALASPVEIELTAREAELFASHADALAELGFDAEQRADRSVAVIAVPAVFDTTLEPELLRDVLGAFVSGDGEEAVDDVADELLADLACYPSVTGNTSLTEGSVSDLLSALDSCENPYACPHGRPVVIELSDDEIGERFERDYPGHAGRRRE